MDNKWWDSYGKYLFRITIVCMVNQISIAKELEPEFKATHHYNLYERMITHSEKLLLRITNRES